MEEKRGDKERTDRDAIYLYGSQQSLVIEEQKLPHLVNSLRVTLKALQKYFYQIILHINLINAKNAWKRMSQTIN